MNVNWNKGSRGKPGLTRTKREARVIPHLRNNMAILGSIPHKLNYFKFSTHTHTHRSFLIPPIGKSSDIRVVCVQLLKFLLVNPVCPQDSMSLPCTAFIGCESSPH